jgi:hypothetical protein
MRRLFFALAFLPSFSWSAVRSLPIPRLANHDFRSEGLFEGGTSTPANIEKLTRSEAGHAERWTFDFSETGASMASGKAVPKFQLKYLPGNPIFSAQGEATPSKPPRLILTLRGIQKNLLKRSDLLKQVKQSKYVKEIIVYPPIEEGDTALEIQLKDNVQFAPHQPAKKAGQLVLDLKEGLTQKF